MGGKILGYDTIVDDYSIFTCVKFIKEKSEVFEVFKELCHNIQREKDCGVIRISSAHRKEFENNKFEEFCASEGISHGFSSPNTPQ